MFVTGNILNSLRNILFLSTCLLIFGSSSAIAELTVTLSSISPSLTPRDGTIPPQEGVELFVFPGTSLNTEYTAVFDVNEEPASTVLIAATLGTYAYDSDAGTVTIEFTHSGYATGVETPGPPTDFSIAFVGANDAGANSIPTAMRGSWMSTNIGPSNWELVPPSEESPAFGYNLSGPEGETGFFKMFVPETMIDYLSAVFEESLTIDDLAVFNDDYQTETTITEIVSGNKSGVLVDIFVRFEDGSVDFPDDDSEEAFTKAAQGDYPNDGTVSKEITMNRALDVSLTADDVTPTIRSIVTVYGWVKDGIPGEYVKITSKVIRGQKVKKGGKALARYKKNGWKKLALDETGKFSFTYKAKKNDVIKAIYKVTGQPAQKSKNLRVRPARN